MRFNSTAPQPNRNLTSTEPRPNLNLTVTSPQPHRNLTATSPQPNRNRTVRLFLDSTERTLDGSDRLRHLTVVIHLLIVFFEALLMYFCLECFWAFPPDINAFCCVLFPVFVTSTLCSLYHICQSSALLKRKEQLYFLVVRICLL